MERESDRKRRLEEDINETEIKRCRVAEFVDENELKRLNAENIYEIDKKRINGTRSVDEIDCATVRRQVVYRPFILLAPDSDHSFSGSESEHSIQLRETDEARDTSDTSYSSDSVTSTVEFVEYEVATESEDSENALGERLDTSSTSSSMDRKLSAGIGAIAKSIIEDDFGLWADSSSEESDDDYNSSDSEIPKGNYLHCAGCKKENDDPHFRFCEKCFRSRKDFHPRRPPPKKKSLKIKTSTSEKCKLQSKVLKRDTSPETSHSLDEGISSQIQFSSSSSQELISYSQEMPSMSSSEYSQQIASEDRTQQDNNKSTSEDVTLCSICYMNPVNAVFIHRHGVHAVSCIKCANKLWKSGKPCPICNKKIERATRVYFDGDKLVLRN